MHTVASPDPDPDSRGGGQLPNPNEFNFTLTEACNLSGVLYHILYISIASLREMFFSTNRISLPANGSSLSSTVFDAHVFFLKTRCPFGH